MKTIIHLELSDLERGHLANWIDRRYGKRMVSRNEVTMLCREHIAGLIQGGAGNEQTKIEPSVAPIRRNDETGEARRAAGPEAQARRTEGQVNGQANEVPDGIRGRMGGAGKDSSPGRTIRAERVDDNSPGEEYRSITDDWPSPSAATITAACRRVLQHIKENEASDTLSLGWCASTLLATGIE